MIPSFAPRFLRNLSIEKAAKIQMKQSVLPVCRNTEIQQLQRGLKGMRHSTYQAAKTRGRYIPIPFFQFSKARSHDRELPSCKRRIGRASR